MRNKLNQLQRDTLEDLSNLWGCSKTEFRGRTFEELLTEADSAPVVVYWGCWTEADLITVIWDVAD